MLLIDDNALRKLIQDTIRDSVKEYVKNELEQYIPRRRSYTRKEAMEVIKCGYSKVNNLIREGHLTLTADGRRITSDSLMRYLSADEPTQNQ